MSKGERDAIDLYLERVIPAAVRTHGLTEGAVQSVVSKAKNTVWAVLDREVVPSYLDVTTKTRVLGDCAAPLLKAIAAADEAKSSLLIPTSPKSLGAECDLLALDRHGRVLAIEVKPMSAGTIAWVPAQAPCTPACCSTGSTPTERLHETFSTACSFNGRRSGTPNEIAVDLPARPEVVPVIVLQRGGSKAAKQHMTFVKQIIDQRSGVARIETDEVSVLGEVTPLT
jgi:hypothetical protein